MLGKLLQNTGRRKEFTQFVVNSIRSNHQRTLLSQCGEKTTKHGNASKSYTQKLIKIFKCSNHEGGQINRLKLVDFFSSWRTTLELKCPKVENNKSTGNFQKDIVSWFTGVLAVTSVILGHKWVHQQQKENCPLLSIDVKALENVVTDCLPREHLIFAVNSSSRLLSATEKKVQINDACDTKEATTASTKLDKSVAAFREVANECNGTLLNNIALKFKQVNQHKKALELFKQASSYGHVSSYYNLGICYELGQGGKKSYEKAFKYYKMAAENGHAKSMYNIATFYYEDLLDDDEINTKAFSYMLQAADQGLVQAQVFVADQFANKGSWTEAIKYFQLAAEQDDFSSIFNLATCFDNGLGIAKNNIKTIEYYKKAANGGHILSQHRLGESYEYGLRGLTCDVKEAMKWYKQASIQGHTPSTNRLELLEYEIKQYNEDLILNSLEINPVLSLLKPVQDMFLHKSSSMPSLPSLAMNAVPSLFPQKVIHGSMKDIYEHGIDDYITCIDEGYNGSPFENKEFQLVSSVQSDFDVPTQCNCWFCH